MKYIDDTPELFNFSKSEYPKNKAWNQNVKCDEGVLVVLEGIDGSGKSTQCKILENNLKKTYKCSSVNFIHSDFLKVPLLKAKWENADAYTFLYLYLMGLSQVYFSYIIPHLRKNEIVILDRYVQTIYVKLLPFEINEDLLKLNTRLFRKPDISIFINSDPEVCMKRKIAANGRLTYWESGGPFFKRESMRQKYDPEEYKTQFVKFQKDKQKVLIELAKKNKTLIIDGNNKISRVSKAISQYTLNLLEKKNGL